eukprot:1339112-Rhodomonas_salina.1
MSFCVCVAALAVHANRYLYLFGGGIRDGEFLVPEFEDGSEVLWIYDTGVSADGWSKVTSLVLPTRLVNDVLCRVRTCIAFSSYLGGAGGVLGGRVEGIIARASVVVLLWG